MRASTVKIAFVFLSVVSAACFGAGLADYEATCLDLGFKKRTPAYGECVLELDRRATADQKQAEKQREEVQRQAQEQQQREAALQRQQQEQQRAAEINQRGDGTADHQTCYRFGFVPGTSTYSDCRLKISIAKREAEQRQAAYEAEQRRYQAEQKQYEAKLAEYEREKERQRGLALMRFGAALAGGTSPYFSENVANAGRASLGMPPVAPTRPQIQNFTITRPGAPMTTCSVIGNNVNCF